MMAGNPMGYPALNAHVPELRIIRFADVREMGAARMETAAIGRVRRAGYVSF
jgi:hypothetical protein